MKNHARAGSDARKNVHIDGANNERDYRVLLMSLNCECSAVAEAFRVVFSVCPVHIQSTERTQPPLFLDRGGHFQSGERRI